MVSCAHVLTSEGKGDRETLRQGIEGLLLHRQDTAARIGIA